VSRVVKKGMSLLNLLIKVRGKQLTSSRERDEVLLARNVSLDDSVPCRLILFLIVCFL
jgi:hypothetical protein